MTDHDFKILMAIVGFIIGSALGSVAGIWLGFQCLTWLSRRARKRHELR